MKYIKIFSKSSSLLTILTILACKPLYAENLEPLNIDETNCQNIINKINDDSYCIKQAVKFFPASLARDDSIDYQFNDIKININDKAQYSNAQLLTLRQEFVQSCLMEQEQYGKYIQNINSNNCNKADFSQSNDNIDNSNIKDIDSDISTETKTDNIDQANLVIGQEIEELLTDSQ